MFGPSMVIGGCTGVAVGRPSVTSGRKFIKDPGVWCRMGIAGFFAVALHNAPISTIIMVEVK